jgi:hypothetical protein
LLGIGLAFPHFRDARMRYPAVESALLGRVTADSTAVPSMAHRR